MKKQKKIPIKGVLFFLAVIILVQMGMNISTKAAEEFPSRPVEFVVCYAPGGGADMSARIILPFVEKYLGVPIYINNKGGGGGTVGVLYALKKEPDGYTLFGIHQFSTFVGAAFDQLPWQPKGEPYKIQKIYPICNWIDNLNLWAVPADSPFKTFKDLLEYAKQNPGKLKYGVGHTRASQGICVELLKYNAGIDVVPVAFKNSANTMAALLGKHTDIGSIPYGVAKPHIQVGTVRALIVFGKNRDKSNILAEELPDVPSEMELGYEESPLAMAGAGCSDQIPKDRIEKISVAFEKAFNDPKMLEQLKKAGFANAYLGPDELRKYILDGYEKIQKIKYKLKD